MSKRVLQVQQQQKGIIQKAIESKMKLSILNTNQTWEKAYNVFLVNHIEIPKLISLAGHVHSEFCVSTVELGVTEEIIKTLLENFPIIRAKQGQNDVLIDHNELLMQPDCFLRLLTNQSDENIPKKQTEKVNLKSQNQKQVFEGPKQRLGRRPLFERFPTLIECATDFIKQHSFSAHVRRRESTATGTGVSVAEIRSHLLKNVPGLAESGGISRDAIHQLTTAPRKNTNKASRYKGLIEARIPGKRNQYREDSKNQHFLFSRVAYREELAVRFGEECKFYSADDMNKIRMGPATAVSRYHQINRFFMNSDSPNLKDHDFPNPGYLLCPSGYMSLTSSEYHEEAIPEEYTGDHLNDFVPGVEENVMPLEENNVALRQEMMTDKLGRAHYKRFTAGPSLINLRSCMFDSTTCMTHCNDLFPILNAQVNDGKTCAFIKVDNGPDWNLHSLVNAFYLHRLWKDAKLDILCVLSYAAKYSAYNNVEHLWSPMSKRLCSLVLPSILEGDVKEPCKMSELSTVERKIKEKMVNNFSSKSYI